MSESQRSFDLAGKVIGCAMRVHRKLGYGFNEKVYQNSLAIELQSHGIEFTLEKKIQVSYQGTVVGDFAADIYVSDALIIELKAVSTILPVHEAQLVNYLTATGIKEGLLLNFGAASLQFKKKFKDYSPKSTPPPKLQK